jgi:hypothetical protein
MIFASVVQTPAIDKPAMNHQEQHRLAFLLAFLPTRPQCYLGIISSKLQLHEGLMTAVPRETGRGDTRIGDAGRFRLHVTG